MSANYKGIDVGSISPSYCRWLLAYFDYFELGEIAPMRHPRMKQRRIICFHQLKATKAAFFEPAIDVEQPVWQHSPFLEKPLVRLFLAARQERLKNHVLRHR
jgi:hypothetical protein